MLSTKCALAKLALLLWVSCTCGLQAQKLILVDFQPSDSSSNSIAALDDIRLPAASLSAESSSIDPSEEGASGAYIRSASIPAKPQYKVHLFSTIAFSPRSNTLGPGLDIATPLSRSFNLRAGINYMAFGYTFPIDGVNYSSRLHFQSGQMKLDWFPTHRSFHISPGVMYGRNRLSATSWVPAGQFFELGSQGFTNSVDDPLNGLASVALPRNLAPTLTVGFGNMIPRSGRHLSFPTEFGVAYSEAPRINVTLDGTACTSQGCFAFSQNPDAVKSLRAEIQMLNEKMKRLPVYPILSSGIAIRF